MAKVYFLLGTHNHQPVGNFGWVFEEAYEKCYFPFLSALEQFPNVQCSIHNTGPLYDWIKENRPEYMDLLKRLVDRGQVELLSGGYYEPILPLVTDSDKIGQINMMNSFVKKEFKQDPQGMWLAERVWEPYLARIMNQCGIKYTFLDDTHFRYAGLSKNEFFGYYTTEDEAQAVNVFPVSKTLRYKIPFSEAQEAIDILNGFACDRDILVTLYDDGEKFGMWPGTYDWVYTKGWLRKFFSLLSNSSVIKTILPKDAIERFSTNGLVYLPTASYEEMGEWVLEPKTFHKYELFKGYLQGHGKLDEYSDFIRGGFFRNFHSKYDRLNYMHKRMLNLSKKIHGANCREKSALDSLWKAQTNCGYWHGVFGGFYLGHIRSAVYQNLIEAENAFDKKKSSSGVTINQEDIDLDGNDELLVKNKDLICCFSQTGGTLLELSARKWAWNLQDTITRQEESYHVQIRENNGKENNNKDTKTIHDVIKQKDKDLDKYLIYDSYERRSLVDLLLPTDLSIDDFNAQRGVLPLANNIYDCQYSKSKSGVDIDYTYQDIDLDFVKTVKIGSSASGFSTEYKFNNNQLLSGHNFGVEFNLSLPSPEHIFKIGDTESIALNKPRAWYDQSDFVIEDKFKKAIIEFKCSPADVFSFPLYSVSSSEGGFEKVYQQLVVVFIFKGQKDKIKIDFNIKKGG